MTSSLGRPSVLPNCFSTVCDLLCAHFSLKCCFSTLRKFAKSGPEASALLLTVLSLLFFYSFLLLSELCEICIPFLIQNINSWNDATWKLYLRKTITSLLPSFPSIFNLVSVFYFLITSLWIQNSLSLSVSIICTCKNCNFISSICLFHVHKRTTETSGKKKSPGWITSFSF